MQAETFTTTRKATTTSVLLWGVLFIFTVPAFAAKAVSTITLRSMARVYMAYGDYDKALAAAQGALAQAETQQIEGEELALCLIDLGTVYGYQDMLEESARMLDQGVRIQKQAVGNHPYTAYTLQMLCDVYLRQGQYGRAQNVLDEALSIMATCHSRQSRDMLSFEASRARLLAAQGQIAQADALYAQILESTLEAYGPAHLQTAAVLAGFAETQLLEGKTDCALEKIDRAIAIEKIHFGRDHRMLIPAWLTKARICRAEGNTAEAEIWLDKAIVTTQSQNNIIALARIHEKVNAIRSGSVYVAMK